MYFHYELSIGAVFSIFAGFYFWVGKFTGLKYNETLGKIGFYLSIKLPCFLISFLGLDRTPQETKATVSSFGSAVSLIFAFLFLFMVLGLHCNFNYSEGGLFVTRGEDPVYLHPNLI